VHRRTPTTAGDQEHDNIIDAHLHSLGSVQLVLASAATYLVLDGGEVTRLIA
jgi:hypothetical protein